MENVKRVVSVQALFIEFAKMYQDFKEDLDKLPRLCEGYSVMFSDFIRYKKRNKSELCMTLRKDDSDIPNIYMTFTHLRNTNEYYVVYYNFSPKSIPEYVIKAYIDLCYKHEEFINLYLKLQFAKFTWEGASSLHIQLILDPFSGIDKVFFSMDDRKELEDPKDFAYDRPYKLEKDTDFQVRGSNLLIAAEPFTPEEFKKPEYKMLFEHLKVVI